MSHGLITIFFAVEEEGRMTLSNLVKGISIVMTNMADNIKVINNIPKLLIQIYGVEK